MTGIIFDVDGTLWDSTDVVAEAWNLEIDENSDLNPNLTGEELKSLFGKTMEEIFDALFPSLSSEEKMRLGTLCYEYENRLLEDKPGNVYEGVIETFHTLSDTHPLFIVSNCQCGYIEAFLKSTGLNTCVKDHLCYGETLVSKGQTIRMLMERNQLKEAVYVGDTLGDFNACKEAGIPFIFAEYGFGDVPEADRRIQSISQLAEMTF